MPTKPPRVCPCGFKVPASELCACQQRRELERKARFDLTRPSARKRGYTAEWERERAAYLKANPCCRMCGQAATVVDHIQAHKGNQKLFWNRANWQPLCANCHNSHKQRQERRAS